MSKMLVEHAGVVGADGSSSAHTPLPDIQRTRILAALVEVVRELGVAQLTVAHIVERSGVSRRTFYEVFADREACFLAALEEAIELSRRRVLAAVAEESGWRGQIRAGLRAVLELFDEEPGLAGLCVVDSLGAGPAVLQRRTQVVQQLVGVVHRGRLMSPSGLRPSRVTAEGIVGGVLAVLHERITSGERKPLSRLASPLMAMIVMPYLGPVVAGQEASRVSPRARSQRLRQRPSNPLEGLHMRLTYRTVRVLCAVAAEPDASNRRVAAAAGVQDPGQISKLLARLESVGLVENAGVGPRRGEPNAWRLTARGWEVRRVVEQSSVAT
jgi:AcrR family transcriptional regulator